MTLKQKVVSVFGSSAPLPNSADYESARTVGRLLARAGCIVQTGGYSGVMAAASQGAVEAGGHTIGVTSAQIEQFRPAPPNEWVKEEIKHQTLRERLLYLIENCDGVIVMPGGIGTLSELSLVWSFVQTGERPPLPIVTVGGLWQRTLAAFIDPTYIKPVHQGLVIVTRTAQEAVDAVLAHFKKEREES
ncbi:MAG: LOG family protein [Anaerolineae bacterium]|nr:LOG family protein [Anaerolineae bacterium]